jgi:hypothetical protein
MARHLQVFANDCAGMGRFHRRNFGLAKGFICLALGVLDISKTMVIDYKDCR